MEIMLSFYVLKSSQLLFCLQWLVFIEGKAKEGNERTNFEQSSCITKSKNSS